RATGGLNETVKPFSLKTKKGNGFVFKEYSAKALLKVLSDALSFYKNPQLWQRILMAGLQENFSLEKVAKRYARLYRKALKIKKGG
ncbi:hypothetical protein ACFLRM_01410, partial [Acidobacteriota bacterium]